MTTRIGILGGSFDPIHCGHVDAGMAAEQALRLTTVLLMPSRLPPHRPQPVASAFHRFAMVGLTATAHDRWQASDFELLRETTSYTSITLQWLHARGHQAIDLFLIVGADAFAEVATWKDYPEILNQAHFVVVSRNGTPASDMRRRFPHLQASMVGPPFDDETMSRGPLIFLIDARTTEVSSTAIRQHCALDQSIAGLVEPAVAQHIQRHGLYSVSHAPSAGSNVAATTAAGRLHDDT
jgi:nicotinate-nucleotide adenylyltransferase